MRAKDWRILITGFIVVGILVAGVLFDATSDASTYNDPPLAVRRMSTAQRLTLVCFYQKGLRYPDDYRFGRRSKEWKITTPIGLMRLGGLAGWRKESMECVGYDI